MPQLYFSIQGLRMALSIAVARVFLNSWQSSLLSAFGCLFNF